MPPFEYFTVHPEARYEFEGAMDHVTAMVVPALIERLDVNDTHTVVDVGGCNGGLLGAILRAHPGARGVLFDLPRSLDAARRNLENLGVAGRCEIVKGDFFVGVPSGADRYLLKNVLHDWEDSQAIAILNRCREALAPQGKVLILEMVLKPDVPQPAEHLMDIAMLLLGGRERDESEYRILCERAGLYLRRVVPTRGPFSIIEAEKAG